MRVLIYGAGVAGCITGKGLVSCGHDVTFVDTDPDVVRRLQQGGCSATMPMSDTLARTGAEVAFVCVPAPLEADGRVSFSAFDTAVRFLGTQVRDTVLAHPLLIVVQATVPPGTTRNRVWPLLRDASGPHPNTDFRVSFHPQILRADAPDAREEVGLRPGKLVVGVEGQLAEDKLRALYTGHGQWLTVTTLEVAELVQYVAHSFNAAKMSFSNEIWLLASSLGIDGSAVLDIASDVAEGYTNPKYGTKGGQPYDDPSLRAEPLGLLVMAQQQGLDMPLLAAALQVDLRMEQIGQGTSAGASWMPAPRMRPSDKALAALEQRSLLARPGQPSA